MKKYLIRALTAIAMNEFEKAQELIIKWLATGKDYGKSGDLAWSVGDTFYSKYSPIAKKDGKNMHITNKHHDKQTSEVIAYLTHRSEYLGYKIDKRNEVYIGIPLHERVQRERFKQ